MTTKRRVLFIPCFTGIPSHFITLVKLQQRLDPSRFESAFYLPKLTAAQVAAMPRSPDVDEAVFYYGGEFYSRFDVPMLDIDAKRGVSSELAAYARFRPDVVVDDCSLLTALARQVRRVPRVTVLRAGALSEPAGGGGLPHSLQPLIEAFRGMTRWGMPLPEKLADWFDAEAYVIPGIESLESDARLGARAVPRERTFFCGPLLLDEREERLFESRALQEFAAAHAQRRIAYVTFGIVAVKDVPEAFTSCLRHLYDLGFAVITNLPAASVADEDPRCFRARAVPMHQVCSRADLVIHVSGSAAYHYPILHGRPAITVGTRSRDREATALALQAAGLTRHLPYADSAGFERSFRVALEDFLAARHPFDGGLGARLAAHRAEIERTVRDFDFSRVIDTALANVDCRQASVN